MTFIASVHSGTKSLADLLNAESTVYSRTWILKIYDMKYLTLPTFEFEKADGKLEIKWGSFPIEIKSIGISKSIDESGFAGFSLPNVNLYQNYCYDDSYIGERAAYHIYAYDIFDDYYDYSTLWCEKDFPELKYEIASNNKIRFYWDKCRYPDNFNSYMLYHTDDYKKPFTFSDINNCEYVFEKTKTGSSIRFFLLVIPKIHPDVYKQQVQNSNINSFLEIDW